MIEIFASQVVELQSINMKITYEQARKIAAELFSSFCDEEGGSNSFFGKAWDDYEDFVGDEVSLNLLCDLIVEAMAYGIYLSENYISEKSDDK